MKNPKLTRRDKAERGYTLLEYCAGAAIIAGILFSAMNNFGTKVNGLFTSIGTWTEARGRDLNK